MPWAAVVAGGRRGIACARADDGEFVQGVLAVYVGAGGVFAAGAELHMYVGAEVAEGVGADML